jgi:hypothetical protein
MARAKLTDANLNAVREEMRAEMIACARARETITYSELSMRLQTAYIHYHSTYMVRLLDDIGRQEFEAGRPILPAVVVRKSNGIPGGGYFRELAQMTELPVEMVEQWRKDLEAVFDYWADA